MPTWVEVVCAEYIKRMPRELPIEIIEIKPDKRAGGKIVLVVQEAEAQRILKAVNKDYWVVFELLTQPKYNPRKRHLSTLVF